MISIEVLHIQGNKDKISFVGYKIILMLWLFDNLKKLEPVNKMMQY